MSGTRQKSESGKRQPSKLAPAKRQASYGGEGWAVKAKQINASGVYATKAEAVQAARKTVGAKQSEPSGQKRPDHQRQSFTIGRADFQRISAVEGVRPTVDALARARKFDSQGLPSEERRRVIIEAYCVKA